MTLGEYIRQRRTALGISRHKLAMDAGISHTEVHRIETGERKMSSLKVLCAIAESLSVPQEELLKVSGYAPSDDLTATERAFPGLKTPKQRETVEKIVDGLSRNAQLKDEDLDALYKQVDMFLRYAEQREDT